MWSYWGTMHSSTERELENKTVTKGKCGREAIDKRERTE